MSQLKKTRRAPQPSPAFELTPRDAQVYITNKNVITFWLLLFTQLFYAIMYGLFINVNEVQITNSEDFVHTALLFVLVIGGFGLVLVAAYQMVWTSLGFNLLITALSVQTYFLVHAFWSKVMIYWNGSSFNVLTYTIYLTPDELITTQTHATLNQAIKCSLSCIVAFSFIAGRAGLLELYWLTVTGTTIYELTRQICLNVFPYQVGTIKIFLFGSVLGLVVSFIIRKLGREANTIDHFNNFTNRPTIILTLVGTLVCWALFPLLTRQTTISQTVSTTWGRVFSIVLAMSSAGLFSIFLGYVRYGFKMVTYSVIGAGVATLSSSAYISNPVYAIVFGLSSAIAQIVFLSVNTRLKQIIGPMDPHAYVFIGHSFLGIFYEAINRQIVQNNPNSLVFDWLKSKRPEYVLGTGAITIGIALVLGFLIGTLFACCAYHEQIDHFTDYTYWEKGDGISQEKNEEVVAGVPGEQAKMYIEQHNQPIKQRNAYL